LRRSGLASHRPTTTTRITAAKPVRRAGAPHAIGQGDRPGAEEVGEIVNRPGMGRHVDAIAINGPGRGRRAMTDRARAGQAGITQDPDQIGHANLNEFPPQMSRCAFFRSASA